MARTSKRVAVIGLGNTLHRDDGIGIHLLSLLEEKVPSADISFMNFGVASLGLINHLSSFSKILLVDAIDAGLEPGALRIFRLSDAASRVKDKKIVSRELPLADLSRLYEAFGFQADVQIAGVQVKDVSYGLEMTQELETAKERIAEEIKTFLTEWHKD
jgi:hydrogenase maturation protease